MLRTLAFAGASALFVVVACGEGDDETPAVAGAGGGLAGGGAAGAAGAAGASGASGGGGGGASGAVGAGGGAGSISLAAEEVRGGLAHSCVMGEGRAYCWGSNERGQLGNGRPGGPGEASARPEVVGGPSPLTGVAQLALGGAHSCARLNDGRVACWGSNERGQLGRADNAGSVAGNASPLLVEGAPGEELAFVRQAAAGANHACALLANGGVVCWGDNARGQLGRGPGVDAPFSPAPAPVGGPAGGELNGMREIALGGEHACGRTADGRVLCWGSNRRGQLGRAANAGAETPNPTAAAVRDADGAELSGVRSIAAGAAHACALLGDGRVLCWGANDAGQIGAGAPVDGAAHPAPVVVEEAGGAALGGVSQLALGGAHSCALTTERRALCWGRNDFGQLGNPANAGTPTPNPAPLAVDDGAGAGLAGVRLIDAGGAHGAALGVDGRLLIWGSNAAGQLGEGASAGPNAAPRPVPGLVTRLPLDFLTGHQLRQIDALQATMPPPARGAGAALQAAGAGAARRGASGGWGGVERGGEAEAREDGVERAVGAREEFVERAVVLDDEVGGAGLLGGGELRADARERLGLVEAVAAHEPRALAGLGGEHDDEGAEGVGHAVLDQQRGFVAGERRAGRFELGEGGGGGGRDARVGDGVEARAARGVGEHERAEGAAVDRARGVEHAVAEGGDDVAQALGARGDHVAGEAVSVEHGQAPGGEAARDRALAAGDISREAKKAGIHAFGGARGGGRTPRNRYQKKRRAARARRCSGPCRARLERDLGGNSSCRGGFRP